MGIVTQELSMRWWCCLIVVWIQQGPLYDSFIVASIDELIFTSSLSCAGSLKYWYERNKVNFLVANSAVWNDDAVNGALDSASFWVKGLPFVKSLSGYWKFFLASRPSKVPENFYDSAFHDSEWETLPGKYA